MRKPNDDAAIKAEFKGTVGAKVPKTIQQGKNQDEMCIFFGPHRLRLQM